MKTVRILLYPDEEQIKIMEGLVGHYCEYLLNNVKAKQRGILPKETLDIFGRTTSIQLCRDIRRRLNQTCKGKMLIPHLYCRWGDDYQLSQTQVVLPLGARYNFATLKINCIYRPFQQKLLISKHPETLILKRMKHHWFAYLLVHGDN